MHWLPTMKDLGKTCLLMKLASLNAYLLIILFCDFPAI